ncbi:MAG: YHS domain-containing (seleno)protein [Alphaproteobacteria bacterium]
MMKKNRRVFLYDVAGLLGLLLAWMSPKPVLAIDPFYKIDDNVAASGYDVVAYFTLNSAVKGDPKYQTTYKMNNGKAKFYFSSTENLQLFKSNPKKYAPQFGGYCAYAVANNYIASTDPKAFSIFQNKLYLNYNISVRRAWLANRDDYIVKGKKNWPLLLKQ